MVKNQAVREAQNGSVMIRCSELANGVPADLQIENHGAGRRWCASPARWKMETTKTCVNFDCLGCFHRDNSTLRDPEPRTCAFSWALGQCLTEKPPVLRLLVFRYPKSQPEVASWNLCKLCKTWVSTKSRIWACFTIPRLPWVTRRWLGDHKYFNPPLPSAWLLTFWCKLV